MAPNSIIIHHSASSFTTTIAQLDAWHKLRDFTFSSLGYYIGYHHVIEADGTVVQTRRNEEMGCHTIPNDGKIGICLIGNFQNSEPTAAQLDALLQLVDSLKKDYNIVEVWGHRNCNNTVCPGDNLYKYVSKLTELNWLQRLLRLLLMPKSNA